MHPVIRIINFILFIAGLAATRHLMFFIAIPIFLWIFIQHCTFRETFPLLKRLRWLFLSLLILNVWFSSPELQWLPDFQGTILGVERIIALIIMVLASHLLLHTATTAEIIAATVWWLRPFAYIGCSTEKIALRLTLVLDTVKEVQQFYTEHIPNRSGSPLQQISERVSHLFLQVSECAETSPLRCLEIPTLPKVPRIQWIIPCMLMILSIMS
jgi:hypothetical protein